MGRYSDEFDWVEKCKVDQVYDFCRFVFTDKAMMDAISQIDTCRLAMDSDVSKLNHIYIYLCIHEHLSRICNWALIEDDFCIMVKADERIKI